MIAGNDRGAQSKVIKVDRATGKAIVEGVNRRQEAHRRSQKNPQGGVLEQGDAGAAFEFAVRTATSCSEPTRLGARFLEDGSKERFCKKCGASAGQIAPAKKAHAHAAAGKTNKPAKAKQQEINQPTRR